MGNFFSDLGDALTFSPIGAATGVDMTDPLGVKAQKAANQATQDRYQLMLQLYDEGVDPLKQGFQKQRASLGKAMGETRAGGAGALSELATLGQRGRQSAKDTGARTLGAGTQSLMSSGLGTSSRMAGLARGVGADTARATQSVNEGVAGARAGVMQQQGDRLAQLQSLLGTSFANEGSALANWRQSKINTIGDRQDVAGPGWLSTGLDLAAGIKGLF